MEYIHDVLDELYSIDDDNWYKNVSNIYCALNFPVRFICTCSWRELIFEKTDKQNRYRIDDAKIFDKCKSIAYFCSKVGFKSISFFSISVDSSSSNRNDDVSQLIKLYQRYFGPYIVILFRNYDEIAFSGVRLHKNRQEAIISEWFGLKRPDSVNEKLGEIYPPYFTYSRSHEFYSEYLWAISRQYLRMNESRMYLVYGCGSVVEKEDYHYTLEDELVASTRVNVEETYRMNAAYYPNLYGDDYFKDEDDSTISLRELSSNGKKKKDTILYDDIYDEEMSDYDWTMLEMELEKEMTNMVNEKDNKTSFVIEHEENSEINGMTPEEVLKYIRGDSL